MCSPGRYVDPEWAGGGGGPNRAKFASWEERERLSSVAAPLELAVDAKQIAADAAAAAEEGEEGGRGDDEAIILMELN